MLAKSVLLDYGMIHEGLMGLQMLKVWDYHFQTKATGSNFLSQMLVSSSFFSTSRKGKVSKASNLAAFSCAILWNLSLSKLTDVLTLVA